MSTITRILKLKRSSISGREQRLTKTPGGSQRPKRVLQLQRKSIDFRSRRPDITRKVPSHPVGMIGHGLDGEDNPNKNFYVTDEWGVIVNSESFLIEIQQDSEEYMPVVLPLPTEQIRNMVKSYYYSIYSTNKNLMYYFNNDEPGKFVPIDNVNEYWCGEGRHGNEGGCVFISQDNNEMTVFGSYGDDGEIYNFNLNDISRGGTLLDVYTTNEDGVSFILYGTPTGEYYIIIETGEYILVSIELSELSLSAKIECINDQLSSELRVLSGFD